MFEIPARGGQRSDNAGPLEPEVLGPLSSRFNFSVQRLRGRPVTHVAPRELMFHSDPAWLNTSARDVDLDIS